MRVWNEIPPENLCRNHLLAEHRETLCIFSVITNNKKGYSKHPEVLRYSDHLGALMIRHSNIVHEAKKRGYDFKQLNGIYVKYTLELYNEPESWGNQLEKLKAKNCTCITIRKNEKN